MKNSILFTLLCVTCWCHAQVGINTTTPNAQLEIKSSNEATPANNDGLLIPKINVFPATNPAAAQQGMLVYLTTTIGTNTPGFYYWNNPTTTWIPIGNNNNSGWNLTGNSGTTNAHFIGTTDNQDLVFKRNSGNSGRIGTTHTSFGSNVNVFNSSTSSAFGATTLQQNSGTGNSAFGYQTLRGVGNGSNNAGFGTNVLSTNSSGSNNSAFGTKTLTSNTIGSNNTAVGFESDVSANNLTNATAIGANSQVGASNSLVLGSINGVNGATSDISVGVGTTIPNGVLDIGSNDKGVLIPRVALTSADLESPVVNPSGGALLESTMVYNTATAGSGANEVKPGFHYWNGTKWLKLEENQGKTKYYTAIGNTDASSTNIKTLMPEMTITFTPKSSVVLVNFSASGFNALGQTPIFFDLLLNGNLVKGFQTSIEDVSAGFNRPIWDINISYPITVTPYVSQTISINWAALNSTPSNFVLTPLQYNGSLLFNAHRVLNVIDPEGGGGIVTPIPIPVTNEFWNLNGNVLTNPSTNFIGTIDAQPIVFKTSNVERMRIVNGNLGIGTTSPLDRLHVTGNIRMVDGSQAVGKVLTSDVNGRATWQNPFTGNDWNLLGNSGTNPTTNFIGTADNQSFVFRTNNIERIKLDTNGNFGIGTLTPARRLHVSDNSTSTTNGQLYLEQGGTGDALMHIGNTGGRHFNIGLDTSADSFKISTSATAATAVTTGTLMTIQPTGEVGIGTTTPQEKLHVSGPAGLTTIRITNTSTAGSTSNVALDFQRGGNSNTDWRIYNIGPNLTIGNSGDELATINDLYQFQGGRFMPMTDGVINLGQSANKWNTLFALNGTINTSDARQKKNIQNLNYGLGELLRLRPVSFEWKEDDGSGTKLGLIAQELQQVIPEVVRDWDWEEDEQGIRKKAEASVLGVYYSDLIPVLIKATQEQQLLIESQKQEIIELKKQLEIQNSEILNRLEKLEKQ